MGAYTNIKGWIQIPPSIRNEVLNILQSYLERADEFSLRPDLVDWYTSGWVIQNEPINGSLFLFYGGEIRTEAISLIKSQIIQISKLASPDELFEYPKLPEGFFHLDEDGSYNYPPMDWLINNGRIDEQERKTFP